MKIATSILVAVTTVLALGAIGPGDRDDSRTLTETLSFTGDGERLLVVDNVFGSITITGDDGDEVRMSARESIHARDSKAFERARREVELVISSAGPEISIVVDGPFRQDDGTIRWNRGLGYEVFYDFEIRVPAATNLVLKTVNAGDIVARNVRGRLEVLNVNGSIEMRDVAGSGHARTVNGAVDVDFASTPTAGWEFATVNGDVDVEVPADLSADLTFQTFNGEVYTDFPYAPRAMARPEPVRQGARTIFKSPGFGVRIAGGGPEMAFSTLNGNIYIRNQSQNRN